ncbi:MAG TPA: MFS transporter [Bacteroidia bacterium]|nr:MFS transporter [Bacteroidia bacterium]
MSGTKEKIFTSYQVFVIAILVFIQFTVILDFMVLSPLGVFLLEDMKITPGQFGLVVSAYAISAGLAGILAAGFADKYDRKKLLMFFYTGFILGTVFCALAPTYPLLLLARIVTGIFGGVLSSIGFAIVTDLFKVEVRGRVMGFTQMAFAVSQVLGLPVGLLLANHFSWHAPFWMIAIIGAAVGIVIQLYLRPITDHLALKNDRSPFQHLWKTVSNVDYLRAFLATTLLATGGFMLMPFGSTFSVNNMMRTQDDLVWIYFATGISTILFGPLIGIMSDKFGKFSVFAVGSVLSMAMVAIYTNLGPTPLYLAIILNIILFIGITSRMISYSSLITAIPKPQDRGAFMSINSSVQQISGGIAAFIAGKIVYQANEKAPLEHYDRLGVVVISSMIIATLLMYNLHLFVKKNPATPPVNTVK